MSEKWADVARRLENLLRLNTFVCGIKFLESANQIPEKAMRKNQPRALCHLIAHARVWGRVVAATREDSLCVVGNYVIFGEDLPEDFAAGKRSVGIYHKDESIAKKAVSNYLKADKSYEAVVIAPLDRMPIDPDVIFYYGNSVQALRAIHGWVWATGERIEIRTVGEGNVEHAIMAAKIDKTPKFELPCNGDRIFSSTQDHEVIAAIPVEVIDTVIEGMEGTHKGGIRYPPVFQMADATPLPTALYFIRREGFPKR